MLKKDAKSSKNESSWFATSEDNIMAETKEKATSQTLALRKDVWTLAKEMKEAEKKNVNNDDAPFETTLLLMGPKSSGKTSIVMRFLDRDETPTPTVALEYTYGRRTRGNNLNKDISHIWELAGGTLMTDLLTIPLTENNIHLSTVFITVDLSKPEEILDTLEHFLNKVRSRTDEILEKLEQKGSKRPKALKQYTWKKYGSEHPDKNVLNPICIPVVIIATKYEALKDVESERRKLLCRALRYVALVNGASLLFCSHKDESLVSRCRQVISHYAFRTNAPKLISIDHSKPVFIMAGQDTLSQIGLPPSEMAKGLSDTPGRQAVVTYESWKADYQKYFPYDETSASKTIREPVDLSKYPEPSIDSLRAQKDEELEKLKKVLDRKSKDTSFLPNAIANKEKRKGKAYSRAKAAQMAPS